MQGAVRQNPVTGQIRRYRGGKRLSRTVNTPCFPALFMERLEGAASDSYLQDLSSPLAILGYLTFGPKYRSALPKYSPDGRHVAFLSDRHRMGDFQLYLLDPISGAARPRPHPVEGWVEFLQWVTRWEANFCLAWPATGQILQVQQGSHYQQDRFMQDVPTWAPVVEKPEDENPSLASRVGVMNSPPIVVRQVQPRALQSMGGGRGGGNEALAAVVFPPIRRKGAWYIARLALIELEERGECRENLRAPGSAGLGRRASPSGRHLAIGRSRLVSDRGLVAGGPAAELSRLPGRSTMWTLAALTLPYTEWRSERQIYFLGRSSGI